MTGIWRGWLLLPANETDPEFSDGCRPAPRDVKWDNIQTQPLPLDGLLVRRICPCNPWRLLWLEP
jgi:hypothetical protein